MCLVTLCCQSSCPGSPAAQVVLSIMWCVQPAHSALTCSYTWSSALLHANGGCLGAPAATFCIALVKAKMPADSWHPDARGCNVGHGPGCPRNPLLPNISVVATLFHELLLSSHPCPAKPPHNVQQLPARGTNSPNAAMQDITESAKDTLLQEEVLSVLIEMGAVGDLIEAARQSGRTGRKRIETHLMLCGGVQSNGELPEGQQLNRQQVRGDTAAELSLCCSLMVPQQGR